jgi:membrane fusion protein (multidrug efflux system)
MAFAPSRLMSWFAALALLVALGATGAGLWLWKQRSLAAAAAAAAAQPEHMEVVRAAVAAAGTHQRTTTSIGTVIALRSITLHNEMPGTVHTVAMKPGEVVEQGTLLVALDVAVEEAELRAQEAEVALAQTLLERRQRAQEKAASSAIDVERAKAERDIAVAQVARTRAIIDRKTIRAPFKAVVGMSDVHVGQYLNAGTQLTTLQGVDEAVHVDFAVTQLVAGGLHAGDRVQAVPPSSTTPVAAQVVAIDARVDPNTRNAWVRIRLEHAGPTLRPGASVRVQVPVGPVRDVVTVPVSALRRGPAGDHVFVLAEQDGQTRARQRMVKSGTTLGDDVVVGEGLQVGERVAASGSFKLFDGLLVMVAPDRPAAGAADPKTGN